MTGHPDGAIPSMPEEQQTEVFYDPQTRKPIPKNILESYRGKQVVNGVGKTVYYGESPSFGGDFFTMIMEAVYSIIGALNGNDSFAERGHIVADWEGRYGPEAYEVHAPKKSALDTADASGPFRTAAAEPAETPTPAPNPAPRAGA